MDKITISTNDLKISFGIDKIKFIKTNNYKLEYDLLKTIIKVFDKNQQSEFDDTFDQKTNILINGNVIDVRSNVLYQINKNYNFDSDSKVPTRSLLTNYLQTKTNQIEYNELLTTINELYKELAVEFTELIKNDIDLDLNVNIEEVDSKSLIKNISVLGMIEDNIINRFNLGYDEIILLQMQLINHIAKEDILKTHWILLDLPYFSKNINDYLNKLNDNVKVICFYNDKNVDISINDLFIIKGNRYIDLSDEIEIYENILMNYPKHIELENLVIELGKMVNEDDIRKVFDLIK